MATNRKNQLREIAKNDKRTIIMEEFLYQINMRKHHTSTAISLQLEFIQSITNHIRGESRPQHIRPQMARDPKTYVPFAHIPRKELQICIPLITNYFSAGETPHGYNLSMRKRQEWFRKRSKKRTRVVAHHFGVVG